MNASLDDAHERLMDDDDFMADFCKRHMDLIADILDASLLDQYANVLQKKAMALQNAFSDSVRDYFRD